MLYSWPSVVSCTQTTTTGTGEQRSTAARSHWEEMEGGCAGPEVQVLDGEGVKIRACHCAAPGHGVRTPTPQLPAPRVPVHWWG